MAKHYACSRQTDRQTDREEVKPCINSVQFKMVSTRSGKSICAPPRLSEVCPLALPLKRSQLWSD